MGGVCFRCGFFIVLRRRERRYFRLFVRLFGICLVSCVEYRFGVGRLSLSFVRFLDRDLYGYEFCLGDVFIFL